MLSKIASQLAHPENGSCLPRTAIIDVLLSEVMSNVILGNDKLNLCSNFIINQN